MTTKYQKEVFQEKIRAYLNALREELNEIEACLDDNETNVTLDEPEVIVEHALNIDKRAHRLQGDIETRKVTNWEYIRISLQNAFADLLESISLLQDGIDGMKPRQDIEQEYD